MLTSHVRVLLAIARDPGVPGAEFRHPAEADRDITELVTLFP
ncbi:hypothetical protein OG389_00965 [Streptomyces sp. NBC_00435]